MRALRPPGPPREPARAMGFCLFNNVAIAARHALDAHGLERVLILDWDVHHGNGTNDIFHADRDVLFVSHPPVAAVPGHRRRGRLRLGRRRGLHGQPARAARARATPSSCSLVEHVVVPVARAYAPQLVLVSAGFDAHRDDPLAGCLARPRRLRGDGGRGARARAPSSTRRSASCSRAATTWTR